MKLLKLRLLISAFLIIIGTLAASLTIPSFETSPLSYYSAFLMGFLIPTLGATWLVDRKEKLEAGK